MGSHAAKTKNHRQVKVFSYTLTLKSAIACQEMLGRFKQRPRRALKSNLRDGCGESNSGPLAQLLRSSGRAHHRVHHRAAKTVLLHSVKSGDSRTAWRGHLIFQLAQVLVALEGHARGTVNGLHR